MKKRNDTFHLNASFLFTAAAIVLLASGTATAQQKTYYETGTVWTGTGKVFSPGGVLVENGKLLHVGKPLKVDEKVKQIRHPDGFLLPCFVDAQTQIAVDNPAQLNEQIREVYPEFEIADLLNFKTINATMMLEEGVLAAYISPGPQTVVSGMGALLNISDRSLTTGALTLSIGEAALSRSRKPTSLAGLGAMLRDTVPAACKGHTMLRIFASKPHEAELALQFAHNQKATAVLMGIERPDLFADLAHARDAILIPRPTIEPDKLRKMAEASKKGVRFAFASWADTVYHINVRFLAALAFHYGMPREEVLKGLTVHAAHASNLAGDGRLARGNRADFAVYRGDPLDLSNPLLMIIAGGTSCYTTVKGTKS